MLSFIDIDVCDVKSRIFTYSSGVDTSLHLLFELTCDIPAFNSEKCDILYNFSSCTWAYKSKTKALGSDATKSVLVGE